MKEKELRTFAPLNFYVSPEFSREFRAEAKKLDIPLTEMLRRAFKTWQNVTAEEEKRKKRAVSGPVNPQEDS